MDTNSWSLNFQEMAINFFLTVNYGTLLCFIQGNNLCLCPLEYFLMKDLTDMLDTHPRSQRKGFEL